MSLGTPKIIWTSHCDEFLSEWIDKRINENFEFLGMIFHCISCSLFRFSPIDIENRLCFENKQSKVNKYERNGTDYSERMHEFVCGFWVALCWTSTYMLHFINMRSYCVHKMYKHTFCALCILALLFPFSISSWCLPFILFFSNHNTSSEE